MRTKVLVVQPLFSVVLDESGQPCTDSEAVCTSAAQPVGEAVGANGVIIAKLMTMLQWAMTNAPQLIAEITAILALFGAKVPATVASDTAAA